MDDRNGFIGERQAILDKLNNSGLAQNLNNLQIALLNQAARRSGIEFDDPNQSEELSDTQRHYENRKLILNSVGAGAIESVVPKVLEIMKSKGMFQTEYVFTNNM